MRTYVSSRQPHPELFCPIVLFKMTIDGSTIVLHDSAITLKLVRKGVHT